MSQSATIVSGTPGGPRSITAIRDLDGVHYAAYFDSAASPQAASKLYTSTDDGVTWAAESWSQAIGATASAAGGDDPVIVCDDQNNIWMGMSKYQGTDSPHVIQRDEATQIWGGPGVFLVGYHRFSFSTGVVSFDMTVDAGRRQSGVQNIVAAYIYSGQVYVSELVDGEQLIGGSAATSVMIAANAGGWVFLAYVDGGNIYYSNRAPGLAKANWTSPVAFRDGSDSVQSVEAVVPDKAGYPAVLYRYNAGAPRYLKLVEIVGSTISYTRVEFSTPGNYNFYPGCSLQYDSRGAVHVLSLYDNGGAGRAEPVRWWFLRPVGGTEWGALALESGSSADSQDTAMLSHHIPDSNGFRPNVTYQGMIGFYLKNDADLIWYNADPYPGASTYPTILSAPVGEPPYREADTTTKTTIALAGEGTAATTFPLIPPQTSAIFSDTFQTVEHQFEAGYRGTLALFEDGRRWATIDFDNVPEASRDSVAAFLEARLDDGAPFTWTIPEKDPPETMDVMIAAGQVRKRKLAPGIWGLGQFMFAEKVVA